MNNHQKYYQLNKKYINYVKKLKGPIIIFGAGGFIGFNLLNSLSLYRDDVFAVLRYPEKNWRFKISKFNLENIYKADLNNPKLINNLIQKLKPQTVFNLAAYGAYSHQKNYEKIYQTNLLSSVNLLEILKKYKFSAYVYAGSSSEYGLNCDAPKENAPLIPNSHYAVSKIANFYLQKYYAQIENLPLVQIRLYSVYGPWEEPIRLIPNLLIKASQKTFPKLVNPEISRDFIYVNDVIKAFILTACKIDKIKGEAFNIGTGQKTTIKHLVLLIKKIYNLKQKPIFASMPNRNWDLVNWYSNPIKANKILHWKAETNLIKGLQLTATWQKEINYPKN